MTPGPVTTISTLRYVVVNQFGEVRPAADSVFWLKRMAGLYCDWLNNKPKLNAQTWRVATVVLTDVTPRIGPRDNESPLKKEEKSV